MLGEKRSEEMEKQEEEEETSEDIIARPIAQSKLAGGLCQCNWNYEVLFRARVI